MLQLVLKGKWFDMIERGDKPEEYRDLTAYWSRRIWGADLKPRHETVRFRHGYGRGAREMVFRIAGLRFGTPLPGMAEGEGPYLCIRLGERLK